MLKALKDPISNVKIIGCKLLKNWGKGVTEKYNKTIKSLNFLNFVNYFIDLFKNALLIKIKTCNIMHRMLYKLFDNFINQILL